MNRTACIVLAAALSTSVAGLAQEAARQSEASAQASAASKVAAEIAKAEQALRSLRLAMVTESRLPGGVLVQTRGEVRVLRGTQPGAPARTFSSLEYSFGDGLRGHMAAARSDDGIVMFEEGPAFGAVFLHLDAATVEDLEWAGEVLDRSDLPGMADGRARSPLGSGLVRDLDRAFELAVESGEHAGQPGRWLRGARRRGLDERDPELPAADRVEVFVRDADRAVVHARFFVGEEVVQSITVEKVECDVTFPADAFEVDGHGLRRREVQDYVPMWEQIEDTLQRAEARVADGVLRPSRRGGKRKKG